MTKFYFDLFNDENVRDEEGLELPDLAAARDRAIAAARDMMAEAIKFGTPITPSHRIEIRDEGGTVLATVAFGEAVTIVGS